MTKYRVSLSTIASFDTDVEADDEESAIEIAYQNAGEASDAYLPFSAGTLSLNDTWELRPPHVEEKK